MKRIAVVILNYNGAEMLRRFLPNVLENSPEANVMWPTTVLPTIP